MWYMVYGVWCMCVIYIYSIYDMYVQYSAVVYNYSVPTRCLEDAMRRKAPRGPDCTEYLYTVVTVPAAVKLGRSNCSALDYIYYCST